MSVEFSDSLLDDLAPLLDNIAAMLGDPKDPIALYNTVVEICRTRFQAEASSLYLVEYDGTTINMVAGMGYSANIVGEARYRKEEGVTGHVWALGKPFKADSHTALKEHPWHQGKMDDKQWEKDKYCWSLIVVPLKMGQRVLGVLKVENKIPESTPFTEDEFQLLQTIASVISLAVENARLTELSHVRVLDALQKTVADLSGEASYFPTTLYGQVVVTCRQIFEAEAASLYLESDDRSVLTMVAGDGYSKVLIGEAKYERDQGITGHVWSKAVSVKTDSAGELKAHLWHAGHYDALQWKEEQYNWSLLAVPVKIRGHVVGVLKVENKHPEPTSFSIADQRLLEMIASIVALSVHNERSVRRIQEVGLRAYDYAHTSKGDLAILWNSIKALRQSFREGTQSQVEGFFDVVEGVLEDRKRSAAEILSIAREGRPVLEATSLADLHKLLEARWDWHLKQRGIELINKLGTVDAFLVADRTMLFVILDNLVQNSIEAIASQQQSSPEYNGKIGFFVSANEDTVLIYICDDALGISPENKDRLFRERFTTKPTGTGLGLTIVKRYVEVNRGTVKHCDELPEEISVEANKHHWKTIFCLTFPRGVSGQLYSVLVVDDRRRFYDYLKMEFSQRPAFGDIDWAENMAQAVSLAKEKRYDMVILDMWFTKPPHGKEIYAELRNTGYQGPVIITSVHQELLGDARRLEGVDDVISKDDAHLIPDRCEGILSKRVFSSPEGRTDENTDY